MHDLNAYLAPLKRGGTLTLVAAHPPRIRLRSFPLDFQAPLARWLDIPETLEMLNLCAEHGIVADRAESRGRNQ